MQSSRLLALSGVVMQAMSISSGTAPKPAGLHVFMLCWSWKDICGCWSFREVLPLKSQLNSAEMVVSELISPVGSGLVCHG